MQRSLSVLVLVAVLAPSLDAQTRSTGDDSVAVSPVRAAPASAVRMELPLLDAPYTVAHGLRAPSMAQSLAVTEGFYEVAHVAIERAWGTRRVAAGLTLLLFDTFGGLLPGGDAWVHEEYHRAVLGNRGIGSFDDVYRLDLSASTISVSHVRDDDLVRLKAAHPA